MPNEISYGLRPLASTQLYHGCDLQGLAFESTQELEPLAPTLGQDRALEAIEFAVGIRNEGYNLYVMGSTGLGKHRLISDILAAKKGQASTPDDWCYVANFDDPHRPLAMQLPAGRARKFREDMRQLVEDLLNAIPAAFQSDEYNRQAEEINQEFKAREATAAAVLAKKAKGQGVALLHTPGGYSLAAENDDHILSTEEYEALPEHEQQRINRVMEELKDELKKVMSQIPIWQREMRKRFKELAREITEITVAQLIADLQRDYADLPAVLSHLSRLKQEVVENEGPFRQLEDSDGKSPSADDPQFSPYLVNLLVDNGDGPGVPCIYENNPTYQNLLGRVEHIARFGTLITDFTLIKSGALHRANGGYLILDVEKLLLSPFAWDALKRVIKSREIRIESLERMLSLASTISLEPQPIPLDLKVILIGDRLLYYLLKAHDPDFGQLFKVAADFSEDFPRNPENDLLYARLIAGLQQREQLRPISRRGVGRIIEQAARRAHDGEKVALHLSQLLDLLTESDYWAGQTNSEQISETHVEAAISANTRRLDQMRERLQEEIRRGTLLIDTDGVQLGRVNGLTVIELGDFAFGMPTRISATARLGSGEVIDIQREIEQAGPIHSKGVFILSAYLARRFARNQPLCVAASLVFEQTYGIVEGDSASVAELCALLSAIGDIPLQQSLAVTGSVNQHGEVQVIGGVCEKIEGFFDICRARALNGNQGVVIPSANQKNLMLRQDLVEAAAAGQFQVYAVRHVDQAMELLTGLPAGIPDAAGRFPLDTVNGKVQRRLEEWFGLRQQISQQAADHTN